MKKAASIIALAALVVSLNLGVAHAQRANRGTYYGSYQGGWNCSWMGGQTGGTAWTGANCPWGGSWRGGAWGMGPGGTYRSGTTAPTDPGVRGTRR